MIKVWATTDGQISISSNSVNVFPVFEVKGDLDLNTGNINFHWKCNGSGECSIRI